MYFGGFYWFPEFSKFVSKIGRFSDKKHSFFCWISKNSEKFFFDGKWIKSVGNASIALKIGKNVPYGICHNPIEGFWDILLFYNFMAAEISWEGDFGVKIAIFSQKSLFLRISAAVKLEKSKISKKHFQQVVVNILRYIFAHC